MSESKIQSSGTKKKEDKNDLTFCLHIVSPSVGVPQTLEFKNLSVNTRVQELKALIRDAVPSRPSHDLQRLIHRGRMLARESETMLEVFGEEMFEIPGYYVIHLVLRPSSEDIDSSSSIGKTHARDTGAPALSAQVSRSQVNQAADRQIPSHDQYSSFQAQQAQQALPNSQTQQQYVLRQVEALQNLMGQRLQQLQRDTQRLNQDINTIESHSSHRLSQSSSGDRGESVSSLLMRSGSTSVQNLISQQQRERTVDQGLNPQFRDNNVQEAFPSEINGIVSNTNSNQYNPTTFTNERSNSNGGRWQITINEAPSATPFQSGYNPHQQFHGQSMEPIRDQHNHVAMRHSDRILAIQNMQNQSRVNALNQPSIPNDSPSSDDLANKGSLACPNSIPSIASHDSSPSNNFDHPEARNSRPHGPAASEPLVYILSSPSGPRAILMSNTQNFFTPLRVSNLNRSIPSTPSDGVAPANLPEQRNRHGSRRLARERRHGNQNLAEPGLAPARADMRAGGAGLQIGQMLWLILRLVGFVWFFTVGSSSWFRWLMVSAMAILVFVIHTGILNSTAEQIWGPIRRHLNTLIPLGPLDGENAVQPLPRAPLLERDGNAIQPIRNGNTHVRRTAEPDPAEMAARLIERRVQQNNGWIMAQIRRAEQALILFIASLVPGVSERHIAHREAEANRDEERQQQLIEAEIEQTAQNIDEASEGDSFAQTTEGDTTEADDQRNEPQTNPGENTFQEQPLIQV
ncbi:unnamed protein product [Blumeria hordei]|uniref:Ubiquitin family protein n=1 Tax=Blumeria hordei TaxID=2867405 RepID=A0A383UQS5_BLUHO|nr:unnamed protein product [Blumeria hordei]